MRVRDAERVVKVPRHEGCLADNVHRHPWHDARPDAQQDCAPSRNDARRRRDGDQPRDHAVDGADDRGLLVVDHVADRPAQQRDGGAEIRVEHGDTGVGGGSVRVATVEAVPSDPEDAGADEDAENVVGAGVLAIRGEARADPIRANEACGPGREMDHIAAGVVDDTQLKEEAAAPNRVRADNIAERQPEGHKDHPRMEVHAAQEGAGGDDEGDGREDELEVDHGG